MYIAIILLSLKSSFRKKFRTASRVLPIFRLSYNAMTKFNSGSTKLTDRITAQNLGGVYDRMHGLDSGGWSLVTVSSIEPVY
jgi:hypothetical protein